MNSIDIRNSAKKDYDLIADQYFNEYGKVIEDIELVDLFLSYLKKGDQIIDLGGGGGNYSNYFIQNGFKAVCYDFSSNMKKHAAENFSHVPYILDDMLNIKNHYANNSVEAIISMYALFHIPKNDINNLFKDINDILKINGLFCFSLQLGVGDMYVDEPYLKGDGKNVLYVNYLTKEEIYELLHNSNFDVVYETAKHETGDNVLGEDGNDAIYIIAKKIGDIHEK